MFCPSPAGFCLSPCSVCTSLVSLVLILSFPLFPLLPLPLYSYVSPLLHAFSSFFFLPLPSHPSCSSLFFLSKESSNARGFNLRSSSKIVFFLCPSRLDLFILILDDELTLFNSDCKPDCYYSCIISGAHHSSGCYFVCLLQVSNGDQVIVQGDDGDNFYVIER